MLSPPNVAHKNAPTGVPCAENVHTGGRMNGTKTDNTTHAPRGRCSLPSPGTPLVPSCPGCSCSRRVPAARCTRPNAWRGPLGRGGSGRPRPRGRPPSQRNTSEEDPSKTKQAFYRRTRPSLYRSPQVCRELLKQAAVSHQGSFFSRNPLGAT